MAREKSEINPKMLKKIQALKGDGESWDEIAKIVGLSRHHCRAYAPFLGFSPPHPNKVARAKAVKKVLEQPVVVQAHPVPRGVPTLPPLPSLSLPPIIIDYNK